VTLDNFFRLISKYEFKDIYVNIIFSPKKESLKDFIDSISKDILDFWKSLTDQIPNISDYDLAWFDETIIYREIKELYDDLETPKFLLMPNYFFEMLNDDNINKQPSHHYLILSDSKYIKNYPLTPIETYFDYLEQLLVESYKNKLLSKENMQGRPNILKDYDKTLIEDHYKNYYKYTLDKQQKYYEWLKENDFFDVNNVLGKYPPYDF